MDARLNERKTGLNMVVSCIVTAMTATFCIFITSGFLVFISEGAMAVPFEKVMVTIPYTDYATIAASIVFITIFILMTFFLFKKSHMPAFAGIHYEDEKEEVNRLVVAFYKMAMAIENRDRNLVVEKNKAEEANQAKSNFLLSISHELRTPMHAILNFAEMGRKKINKESSEKLSLYFSRIEENGERLLRLINGILDLTRLEAGNVQFNFSHGNIRYCLDDSLNLLGSLVEQKNLQIEIEQKTDKAIGVFDQLQISHVFINLISNAIKFTPNGKKITFVIEKKVSPQGDDKSKCFYISIINEGSSIPENELKIIFDKFIQSSKVSPGMGGSGIGLAICREIISKHNGSIWAENTNNGVSFTFVIPENHSSHNDNEEV